MKIGIIAPINAGKLFHRFQTPFNLLSDKATITIFDGINNQNPATDYDVIILNGAFLQPTELLHDAKKAGVKIVWDCDDWITLPTWHDKHDPYLNMIFGRQQMEIAKLADVVWCASKKLAHHFKGHHIPNALDLNQPQWNYTPTNEFDLVWTGGSGHYPTMLRVLRNLPKGKTIIMGGYHPSNENVWKTFDHVAPYQVGRFEVLPAQQYGEIYARGRVAIAPLDDNFFNGYRSPLKALEAAAYGLPILCTDVEAYKDVPFLRKDFNTSIKRLLQSKDLYQEWAAKLKAWSEKEHNLTKINEIRWQTLTQ